MVQTIKSQGGEIKIGAKEGKYAESGIKLHISGIRRR